MHEVAKFGGSSVADLRAMEECLSIIKDNEQIKIVVISATKNTTRELEQIVSSSLSSEKNSAPLNLIDKLINRHINLAMSMANNEKLLAKINEIKNQLVETSLNVFSEKTISAKDHDFILSRGELLSTEIFFLLLNNRKVATELLWAPDFIKTDQQHLGAYVDSEQTGKSIESILLPKLGEKLILTQGYIGSSLTGAITTLGKEGSDYSAALLASFTKADRLTIWTDVAGVYTTDPRLCKNAKSIPTLSYDQATVLTENGAKVLFPKTLAPLREQKIPCYVRKTSSPQLAGTHIQEEVTKLGPICFSINLKENILDISIVGSNLKQTLIEQELENIIPQYKDHLKQFSDSLIKISLPEIDDRAWINKINDLILRYQK